MLRIFNVFDRILLTIAAVVLFILMGLTFVDVIGRNLFNKPLPGGAELTQYALVLVTFLGYPVVALRAKHIVVDLFDSVTGPRIRKIQKFAAAISGATVFSMLAYRLREQGDRLMQYGDVTPQLNLPVSPAYFFMSVLSAVTALTFLATPFVLTGQSTTPNQTNSAGAL